MDLSIIMINHNTKELTEKCIQSIFACKPAISFEIILIDNSGKEEQSYQAEQPGVRVFSHLENKGFGNACNIGAEKSEGETLLFLNSDTLMQEGTLEKCLAYLKQHPEAGILGERTLLADGTLDHACKRGFPTPSASFYYFAGMDKKHPQSRKYGAYRQTFLQETAVGTVDAVAGSFMMMPRQVFRKAGGFDETFFMYGEDLDLCYRVRQLGYEVVYYGKASITHLKGQSGLHTKSKTVVHHFYNAMRIFYKKHYSKKYGLLVSSAVYLGIDFMHFATLLRMRREK